MTRAAQTVSPALWWGFYNADDWQQSLNGMAGYAALDAQLGAPQSMTQGQLSWAAELKTATDQLATVTTDNAIGKDAVRGLLQWAG